jgi:hypothetical protein
MYTVKSSTKAELLNRVMDASAHIRYDKPSLMRSVTSLSRATMYTDIIEAAGNFSLHHRVQNGSGAHPASYPMGTRGFFPGGKAAGA